MTTSHYFRGRAGQVVHFHDHYQDHYGPADYRQRIGMGYLSAVGRLTTWGGTDNGPDPIPILCAGAEAKKTPTRCPVPIPGTSVATMNKLYLGSSCPSYFSSIQR